MIQQGIKVGDRPRNMGLVGFKQWRVGTIQIWVYGLSKGCRRFRGRVLSLDTKWKNRKEVVGIKNQIKINSLSIL